MELTEYTYKGGGVMDIAETIQIISTVGFPIAVATYTLVVLNQTVQRNTEVMTKICAKINLDLDKH